ncbi:MAG TPA: ATP-binding protein [Terriglobales bacterium]|nr:ATP-binding protein [Terriglobales bacterium]
MTRASHLARAPRTGLEARYTKALEGYLRRGGEKELGSAYELGRQAMTENLGAMEIVTIHHRVLARACSRTGSRALRQRALKMSGQFLLDVLSPYEMRQRAYDDAVAALAAARRSNELLEQEAKRIAHAVHDEAAQLLVAAHLAIADIMGVSEPAAREQLLKVNDLLNQVSGGLRQLSHELRPTVLDDLGLVPGVRHLADSMSRRARIPIVVKSSVRGRFPPAVEIGLYRAIQEALANVTKHAKARKVEIAIKKQTRRIVCVVSDDGVGFDPAILSNGNGRKGLGLIGIQGRLRELRGTFEIRSQPGRGSSLQFAVPLEE